MVRFDCHFGKSPKADSMASVPPALTFDRSVDREDMLVVGGNLSGRARYDRNHNLRIMKPCHEAWVATVE